MGNPEGYTTIRAHRDARDEARHIKSRLDLSWNEFLQQAADALDPDSND
ncbi:hypothetical protein [Haloplanus aerogenes]|uniref:CopG family transcriptional regulator n=1 Tax=Haloplanus aerogenes TaxID=660522 RepID=A0A3M0DWY2_9EURY|nr:hypothetical protein [Haloplanus aerogenes]RMB25397.1 hypothetical protein ATH50_0486 [Haloplanus aerogenes]